MQIFSWSSALRGVCSLPALAFVALFGCGGSGDYECSEEKSCGLGSVCVDGACVEQSCATSDQCGIEQYCDSTSTCVSGCEQDTDCMYGDACNVESRACESNECAETRLDCGFNEFCGPDGDCYDAGGYYCHDCDSDADCGGNGNMCLGSGYCGVTCTYDSDCPGGYDCVGVQDNSGNIVAYQCYTSCYLYEE